MIYDKKMTDKRVWPRVALERRRDALRGKLENQMRLLLEIKRRELEILRGVSATAQELVELKHEFEKRGYDK